MWRTQWTRSKVDYCWYIGWDLANQLIELRGKVTPWQRREFCSLVLSDSGMQLFCGSPAGQPVWRLDFLVVFGQFLQTNHSSYTPADSVCTSCWVFWRTITHRHCEACCTVLRVKPSGFHGSTPRRGYFLIACLEKILLLLPSPIICCILLVASTQGTN